MSEEWRTRGVFFPITWGLEGRGGNYGVVCARCLESWLIDVISDSPSSPT